MRRPMKSEAIRRLRRKARFAWVKVKAAIGLTAEVVGDYPARHEAFEAAIVARDRTEDASLEAEALCETKTVELIKGIRRVAHETKLQCGNTIHAPLYEMLLPDGVPPFRRALPRAVFDLGKSLIEKLAFPGIPASVVAFAEPLTVLTADLEASLLTLEAAQAEEEQAKARLETEKSLWITSYMGLFHRLTAHYGDHPELAETFFLHEPKPARSAEDDEEEVPEGEEGENVDATGGSGNAAVRSGNAVGGNANAPAPATAEADSGSAAA